MVEEASGWDVVTPVKLQTVCVLHRPRGCDGDALDEHTRSWCEAVNASGQAHLTPALVDGRWVVRVSIGSEATEWDDIGQLWAAMQEKVAAQEA
jgi:aromatic-L-amino-acid decarboxylase